MKDKEKKNKNGGRKRERANLMERVVMFHVYLNRFFHEEFVSQDWRLLKSI